MKSAEQAVIGGLLLDGKRLLSQALLIVSPSDFEDVDYREAMAAAVEIDNSCRPFDLVTLEERIGEACRIKLVEAAEAVPSISDESFKQYLRIVHEGAQIRKSASIVSKLTFGSEQLGIEEWRTELTKALTALNDNAMDTSVGAKEGFLHFMEIKDNPKEYYQTGMARLDKALKISAGDYVVVGGRPSTGKTAFTLQMMLNMAKRQRVMYFSLETSPDKIYDRLLSNYAKVPFANVKEGNLIDSHWKDITSCYDAFAALSFTVVPAAGWTVSQIKAKALQENAEVIFIDYLGLIKGMGNSIYERATTVSNDLHIMAQQTGIATIALAQLNRQTGREPSMMDLRDSGAIEQDADAIMIISQGEDEDSEARSLYIVKNKEGELSVINLHFKGEIQRFSELDYTHNMRSVS